jgi:hypothetical protein
MQFTNEELTKIYNDANGLDPKCHNPITTERIFTAMRAMSRAHIIEESIATMVANGKCAPDGSIAKLLRKLG